MSLQPFPMPEGLFDEAGDILTTRARIADSDAIWHLERELGKRRQEWANWEPAVWDTWDSLDDGPLMRRAGEWVPDDVRSTTWPTPMSMRDVDAECRAQITNRYAVARGDADAEEDS